MANTNTVSPLFSLGDKALNSVLDRPALPKLDVDILPTSKSFPTVTTALRAWYPALGSHNYPGLSWETCRRYWDENSTHSFLDVSFSRVCVPFKASNH